MIQWAELRFPAINLWSSPKVEPKCKHEHWMNLYSMRKRICYDCGVEQKITNDMPVHHRQT